MFHQLGPDRLTLPQFVRFLGTGQLPLRSLVEARQHLRLLISRSVVAEKALFPRGSGEPRAVALSLGPRPALDAAVATARAMALSFEARFWDKVARLYAASRDLNYGLMRLEVEQRR